jgi:large subunit ribosomal protein L19
MSIKIKINSKEFCVGDLVRVTQKVEESGKQRLQVFEGIVIAIKGSASGKSFTVRRIGVQKIGIEKIFPINSPTISDITVVKKGGRGIRRAKLYYIRGKSKKEIEQIYNRTSKKENKKSAS